MIHIRISIKNSVRLCALVLMSIASQVSAVAQLNFFSPESAYFLPEFPSDRCFELNVFSEFGFRFEGRQECGNKVNVLQLWQPTQNGLSMIRGFDEATPLGQFAARLNGVGEDVKVNEDKTVKDGNRARFEPTAGFSADSTMFTARCRLPYDFSLLVTVPIYKMHLRDVVWKPLTEHKTLADDITQEFLLKDFFGHVKHFGDGLNILSGWQRAGIGDVVMRVLWDKHFPQWRKPVLKDVRLDTYLGLALPTGQKSDINALFSLPFGNDGSTSLLFGGGIELTWGSYLRGGLHVDLSKALGANRIWRIKTYRNQTDLLFLAQAYARKTFGITQRYRIRAEWRDYVPGFTMSIAYYHAKHNRDRLSLYDSPFSEVLANTAENLQEWATHDVVISSEFDLCKALRTRFSVAPLFAVYYKIPIKGRKSIISPTIGMSFTLDF